MSSRLRDLIKAVRSCKTAAEERSVIAKESAAIRTSFKDEDAENRHRNVAKLLYIHMLGYTTHFGQMECLKLIVSPFYADKRIGYLGLMILLDERQEVLMLVTNSLKNDLNHPNQFVVGLALCSLGNISSQGIARDCAPEIEKLLSSTNPYIRKKAALCAIRICRKVPELLENFLSKTKSLLSERNHGVLLTGVSLMIELCEMEAINVEFYRKQQIVPTLVRLLKNLVLSGYAPEHDVSGITDPFLQVKILRLLRLLGKGDSEGSDQMNDILAQVATNTESSKNVGNSILYECVQTIMSIESEGGLKVMAINILGRFLLNRDNNIRYVALNTLSKVVNTDIQAVQRHRNTIVDCLKDPDVSIRRRALDLIYSLVNESNIRILVRELLNFLLISDVQFRAELVAKLCMVTEKYAPTKRWQVDTILRVMSIGGNFIPDDVPSNLVTLISSSPELHSYAVQKLYVALSQDTEQQTLVQVALWCIGEFGDLLVAVDKPNDARGDDENISINVTESEVLDLVDNKVLRNPSSTSITRQYALTALLKLTSRFNPSVAGRIQQGIERFNDSIFVELQQRSVEYSQLFRFGQIKSAVLERMPAYEGKAQDNDGITSSEPVHAPVAAAPRNDAFDLLSMGDDLPTQPSRPAAPAAPNNVLDPFGLFDPLPTSTQPAPTKGYAPTPTPAPAAVVDLLGLLGPSEPSLLGAPIMSTSGNNSVLPPSGSNGASAAPSTSAPFVAYNKNGVLVQFHISKVPGQPNVTAINAVYTTTQPAPLNNFSLEVAVPKYLKVQLNAPSGNVLQSSGRITQAMRIANSMQGQKPLLTKLKIDYVSNNSPFSEVVDVALPAGL